MPMLSHQKWWMEEDETVPFWRSFHHWTLMFWWVKFTNLLNVDTRQVSDAMLKIRLRHFLKPTSSIGFLPTMSIGQSVLICCHNYSHIGRPSCLWRFVHFCATHSRKNPWGKGGDYAFAVDRNGFHWKCVSWSNGNWPWTNDEVGSLGDFRPKITPSFISGSYGWWKKSGGT